MTKKIKALTAGLSVAALSTLLFGAVSTALADSLQNSLDATVDASLETLNLVEGGANGSVNYSVLARDLDGAPGCNLSAAATLSVSVESDNPAVATVSPATLTFENCTDVKTITVTPVSDGQAEVTLSQTANGSAGSFNLSGAAFLVVVANVPAPDTTPPVITYSLSSAANAAGWNNSNVTLTWTVSDPESPILTKTGCNTTVQSTETSGVTFTCAATSAGGASEKSVTIKLDKTKPVVTIKSPKDYATYKQNADVKADWSATDNGSGISSAVGTNPSGSQVDTSTLGEHTFTVTATDKAGNVTTREVSYTVKLHGKGEDKDHGHKKAKIVVCHKGKHSITVSAKGLRAHLKHGDTEGACTEA